MVSGERERVKGTRGGKDPDRTLRRHSFRGGGGGVHFGGNVFGRVRMKMRACWAVRAARLCVRVCLCVRARDAHSLPRSLFPIFCSRLSSHWRSFSIFVLLSSPLFFPFHPSAVLRECGGGGGGCCCRVSRRCSAPVFGDVAAYVASPFFRCCVVVVAFSSASRPISRFLLSSVLP